jgi:ribonuclease HI
MPAPQKAKSLQNQIAPIKQISTIQDLLPAVRQNDLLYTLQQFKYSDAFLERYFYIKFRSPQITHRLTPLHPTAAQNQATSFLPPPSSFLPPPSSFFLLLPMPLPPKIQSIYTDGACSGNPGPGGWGVVVYFVDGTVQEIGGGDRQTTNNRMEMQAAIAALEFLLASGQKEPITLYTDSQYVINGITKWIHGWKKKGWIASTGKAVLNQELWQAIDRLNARHVTWTYVRGHAGNEGNERCDAIARAFSQGRIPALRQP